MNPLALFSRGRKYFVLPLPEELPEFEKSRPPAEKEELLSFWKELTTLHRHEDSLLNSRVQSFLVSMAFLLAAFSQFKDPSHFAIQLALSAVAFLLALSGWQVLKRTACTIEWYREVLNRLDSVLFHPDAQPYMTRRRKTGQIEENARTGLRVRKIPVSAMIGFWLPLLVASMWALLFAWAIVNHRSLGRAQHEEQHSGTKTSAVPGSSSVSGPAVAPAAGSQHPVGLPPTPESKSKANCPPATGTKTGVKP